MTLKISVKTTIYFTMLLMCRYNLLMVQDLLGAFTFTYATIIWAICLLCLALWMEYVRLLLISSTTKPPFFSLVCMSSVTANKHYIYNLMTSKSGCAVGYIVENYTNLSRNVVSCLSPANCHEPMTIACSGFNKWTISALILRICVAG